MEEAAATIENKKKRKTEQDSQLAETESTTQEIAVHPQRIS